MPGKGRDRTVLPWRYRDVVRCPTCEVEDTRVVDSRGAEDGLSIRRRRECSGCQFRFTTFERLEELPLLVKKRSGERVPFDRCNIANGVRPAAKGRPINEEQLDRLACRVEDSVRHAGGVVTTEQVGRFVLDELSALDEVAALRFASVYKGFTQASDFARELSLIKKDAQEQIGA